MRLIRNFMLFIGPISSVFDFLTFYVLLRVFTPASAVSYRLVRRVARDADACAVRIRTTGNPLRSRPSLPLVITTSRSWRLAVLPATPLAPTLGFTVLPPRYFCCCCSRWSSI